MPIDLSPFINAGVSGIILLWFMFRMERTINRFNKNVELMARAILRLLEHVKSEEASNLSKELYRVNGDEES